MDTKLNKEQEMLKKSAVDFLKKEFPSDKIRELEESGPGYNPKQWKKMARLGWLGMTLPEDVGGMEMTFLDLVILMEEIGAYLMPGPFLSTVLAGELIAKTGTDEQKKKLLPKITDGKLLVAICDQNVSAWESLAETAPSCQTDGDDFIMDGTSLFVANAHVADAIMVPVENVDGTNDTALLMIDAKTPGVDIMPMPSMGLNPLFEVNFNNVRVDGKDLIGSRQTGKASWQELLKKGIIAKCAEMVGGMRTILDMTNKYVKERIAYGKPIGTFQVIQHNLADVWIKTRTSTYITYQTAWKISNDVPCTKEMHAAKAWVGQSYMEVTRVCADLHGAIGFTHEHDLGLYFRNARAWDLSFGDGRTHIQCMAQELT